MRFETRAIHAGQEPDADHRRGRPADQPATTFAQRAVGEHAGYEYSRSGNPTRSALEACIASLEEAAHGLRVRERPRRGGRAAAPAAARRHHVLLGNDAYGGTFRLVARVHEPAGVGWSAVDLTDPDALDARVARRDPARLGGDADEPAAHRRRHRSDRARRARTRCDRRRRQHVRDALPAATVDARRRRGRALVHQVPRWPLRRRRRVRRLQRRRRSREEVGFLQNAMGGVPSPFDCYLVLRGVKTLAVRMDRHCENARVIAAMLDAHPAVARVLHPESAGPPRSRRREAPDARLRRDGVVHHAGGRGGRARRRRPDHACSRWRSRSGRSNHSSSTRRA